MRSPHCVLMVLATAARGSAAFLRGHHGLQRLPSPLCLPWTWCWAEVGKAQGRGCWLWHLGPEEPSHASVTGEKPGSCLPPMPCAGDRAGTVTSPPSRDRCTDGSTHHRKRGQQCVLGRPNLSGHIQVSGTRRGWPGHRARAYTLGRNPHGGWGCSPRVTEEGEAAGSRCWGDEDGGCDGARA